MLLKVKGMGTQEQEQRNKEGRGHVERGEGSQKEKRVGVEKRREKPESFKLVSGVTHRPCLIWSSGCGSAWVNSRGMHQLGMSHVIEVSCGSMFCPAAGVLGSATWADGTQEGLDCIYQCCRCAWVLGFGE